MVDPDEDRVCGLCPNPIEEGAGVWTFDDGNVAWLCRECLEQVRRDEANAQLDKSLDNKNQLYAVFAGWSNIFSPNQPANDVPANLRILGRIHGR